MGQLGTPFTAGDAARSLYLEAATRFGRLAAGFDLSCSASAGMFIAAAISSSTTLYSPGASPARPSLTAAVFDGASSMALELNLTRSSLSPTNQTHSTPVILSSSKI